MKNKKNSKLRIIPLGGLEQIGMNITAFEYEGLCLPMVMKTILAPCPMF